MAELTNDSFKKALEKLEVKDYGDTIAFQDSVDNVVEVDMVTKEVTLYDFISYEGEEYVLTGSQKDKLYESALIESESLMYA